MKISFLKFRPEILYTVFPAKLVLMDDGASPAFPPDILHQGQGTLDNQRNNVLASVFPFSNRPP